VAAAHDRGLQPNADFDATETSGFGLSRLTPFGEERLGSAQWAGLENSHDKNASLWFKPARGDPVGFHFKEKLREDAARVVKALTQRGIQVELLSGDNGCAVKTVAESLGVRHWSANVKPQDKIARLEALKSAGKKVLMVGDGLNDAPALAAADASLSPSTAVDISQTAADAVFQSSKLSPVIELLWVARAADRLARQNFAIALAYNALFVPLAIAGYVTPLVAAVAMSASSITVTANAVRLRTKPLEFTR
jgi:P-type Cu2+ transporter